jgi:tetratricopeptide (TPR) repeat protein
VELQSGRLFNQNSEKSSLTPFKHRAFAPYGADTWEEEWYPVLGTRGFVAANQYGALNIKQENGWLKVLFSPVRSFRDTLYITVAGKAVYKRECSFAPLRVFADSVKFNDSLPEGLVVTIGNHRLRYEASPLAGTLSRPVDAPSDFDWSSAYGNYLRGCEALDQKNIPEAEAAFGQALIKDPNYGPALVKMAELLYRNMRYGEALEYASRALRIHTEDGGANFIYGLINEQLGHLVDAKDGFDIASLDPAWRSAAYTRLAKIVLREKDPERARAYAEKAMVNNRYNVEALQLEAICARDGGLREDGGAREILARLDHEDPLNHFSRFEKYIADPTAENKERFLSLIRNELPQETFLELGIWYYDCGLPEDALRVFRLSPPCAEINLWIAWLTRQPIDWTKIDPVRSFPFRPETGQLLEDLLKTGQEHPQDRLAISGAWFLKYQLALIYKDRNRVAECKKLLLSCGDEPDFAPFYAMRAAVFSAGVTGDAQSMRDLQRAVILDPQWRYQKLLAEEDIRREKYKEALTIAGKFYQAHPDQYIMGMLYAKTLLLDHQFAAADKVLTQLNIIPFEGAIAGRELYREAKLMQAVQYMKKQQYPKALIYIGAAKEWPENLGVGKPYEASEDLRLEEWMSYLCLRARHQPAEASAELNKIIAFRPLIDNTVPNFIAANAVITDWAYEKLGQSPPESAQSPAAAQASLLSAGGKEEPGANERILKALSSL